MPSLPIAAQLFTVRDAMANDVEATLRAVAGLGFDGVEFAGLYDKSATELRALLDELGLKVCAAHVALDLFEKDLDSTLETYKTLGCPTVVVPWLPEARRGNYDVLGATLNTIGERARAYGMRAAYHNHDFELTDQGGTTGMQTLLDTTDPDLVGFELDFGWASKVGGDTEGLLRKLAGRLLLLHVKDIDVSGTWAAVGSGVVDYGKVIPLAQELGAEWLVVEHDNPPSPSIDVLAQSIKWLRSNI